MEFYLQHGTQSRLSRDLSTWRHIYRLRDLHEKYEVRIVYESHDMDEPYAMNVYFEALIPPVKPINSSGAAFTIESAVVLK